MKGKKSIILLMIFIFIGVRDVNAINREISNITFRQITSDDGLSQATVQSIFQDSEGYMWFGTEDGLNRYDGTDFKFYRYSYEDEKGLSSNWINCINEDADGNILVATTKGLNKINKTTDKIESFTKYNGNLSNANVNGVFIDSSNRIIVYTENGLNIYDDDKNRFERILYSSNKEVITSQNILDIDEDSNGNYWIATDKGLNRYDIHTEEIKFYTYIEGNNDISDNYINDIYIDKNDNVLIATKGGGINKLNINTEKIEVYMNDQDDNHSLPSNYVKNIMEDNKGRIWVGTDNGLSLFYSDKNYFQNFSSKEYDKTSLVNNNVLDIFQDKQGIIWIGTSMGISLFNPDSIFRVYKNDYLDDNTLSSNMIFGIYEDDDGLIWVGTNDRGINVLDRKNEIVYRLDDYGWTRDIFISNRITDINGSGDALWVATEEEVVYINKRTKEIKKFLQDTDYEFLNIFIDKNEEAWIGTSKGLYKIDNEFNIECYNEVFLKNEIIDNYVSTIFEDSRGIMWIGLGVNGGLLKYDKGTGIINQYKTDINNESTISYDSVKDINEDDYGNIWVGTNHGLNKYDYNTDSFTRYTEFDGLANDFVYEILIDDDQNLWLSTNYGISRYDQNEGSFINFNKEDGLQDSEFNKNSGFKSKRGEMFFGGIGGINSFYPEDFEKESTLSDIIIENVFIDGEITLFKNDIRLRYNEKNLQISYFMPDYKASNKIIYAYKIEGIDKEWSIGKNIRNINYRNLEAGSFKLLIKAKNSSGEWTEPREVTIYKEREPWKTPIAYFIYFLITILIIYIIWNRVKLLDKLIKQRTEELNNQLEENEQLYKKIIENEVIKNNYFINLSHELRTPLNIILSTEHLITDLNKGEEHISKNKISYYMSILKSNSKRLLKLINDIIDTSKIESGEYKLNIKEHDIVYHVEEIAFSMKDFIESNGIEFIVDPLIEEKTIECDIDDIEKCLINILGNAAKFTPVGGKIEVIIEDLQEYVKISIKDTGIGIEEENIKDIFNRFEQAYNKKSEEFGGSGLGLALSKNLLLLHKGDLQVESTFGEGSTFIIILPTRQ